MPISYAAVFTATFPLTPQLALQYQATGTTFQRLALETARRYTRLAAGDFTCDPASYAGTRDVPVNMAMLRSAQTAFRVLLRATLGAAAGESFAAALAGAAVTASVSS